jgi:hypothetical protein
VNKARNKKNKGIGKTIGVYYTVLAIGFDSAAGRFGTVGVVDDVACSVPAAVVGKFGVDDAGDIVATVPLSQGFGGETIADVVDVVTAGR